MPHSCLAPRTLVSSAFVVALLASCLCLGAKPAAAAGFHSCSTQTLVNKGISQLRARHANCRLARQVALARRGGDKTPKGFSCVSGSGSGGDLTAYSCSKQERVVRFLLLKPAAPGGP